MPSSRGYALLDFMPPKHIWLDLDRVVRFKEYVRANLHSLIADLPAECEVDLFAGGHAHNPGLVPLVGFWTPEELHHRVPDLLRMTEDISKWCSGLSIDEVDRIVAATAAPTWEELVRMHVYPTRNC